VKVLDLVRRRDSVISGGLFLMKSSFGISNAIALFGRNGCAETTGVSCEQGGRYDSSLTSVMEDDPLMDDRIDEFPMFWLSID